MKQIMRAPNRFSYTGFSLVESLVALVILSIGMLGIAGLYVESLRAGRTALLRTQAVTLASDMAERIRGNRQGGLDYAKDAADAGVFDDDCEEGGAGCGSAALADHDKSLWQAAVDQALPGAECEIGVDNATTPFTYTITIRWAETGQEDLSEYTMRIQA